MTYRERIFIVAEAADPEIGVTPNEIRAAAEFDDDAEWKTAWQQTFSKLIKKGAEFRYLVEDGRIRAPMRKGRGKEAAWIDGAKLKKDIVVHEQRRSSRALATLKSMDLSVLPPDMQTIARVSLANIGGLSGFKAEQLVTFIKAAISVAEEKTVEAKEARSGLKEARENFAAYREKDAITQETNAKTQQQIGEALRVMTAVISHLAPGIDIPISPLDTAPSRRGTRA